MNLFKVIPKPNHGEGYINPKYIISIRPGYTLNGKKEGADISVQGAMVETFYDSRTPEEIEKILKSYK